MSRSIRVRALGLMPLAALAVHELRFVLAPEKEPGGHGYLVWAVALAGALGALVAAEVVVRVARRAAPAAGARRWLALWLAVAVALTTVYAGQELAEAALCGCRHGGAAAVLGHGGWIAFPLALAVGGSLALALRGVEAVVARVAGRRRTPRPVAADSGRPLAQPVPRSHSPLSAAAGRAPPLLSSLR